MGADGLKKMMEKSNAYDILKDSMNDIVIHSKGLAFDSLVYRFKDYQSRAFLTEVNDYKYKHACGEAEARMKVQGMHTRDLMRFIQILDEVIGEHD